MARIRAVQVSSLEALRAVELGVKSKRIVPIVGAAALKAEHDISDSITSSPCERSILEML